jgi:hypothetical protein
MAGEPLAIGTVLPIGADAPPTTTAKALAGAVWGGIPAVLGGVLAGLQEADVLFPDAPKWIISTIALVLIIISPLAGYFGVLTTPNKLEQAVQIVDTPGRHEAPVIPG